MNPDKIGTVRNLVLDLLESGKIPDRGQLPTNRSLSARSGISLLIVQSAVESLANEGILYKTPRCGVFVQEGWRDRVLQRNFYCFSGGRLPYVPKLRELLQKNLPQLRLTSAFHAGMAELRSLPELQVHGAEYVDLRPMLHSVFPDDSLLQRNAFQGSFLGGKLIGIPVNVSPRLIFCNPQLLQSAGLPVPEPGWRWEEFLRDFRTFLPQIPRRLLRNWLNTPNLWISYFLRAGGVLIDPSLSDPVQIDSPATRRALTLMREMVYREEENEIADPSGTEQTLFLEEKIPFLLATRQLIPQLEQQNFTHWKVLPMPVIPGGRDTSMLAGSFLCIRRECANMQLPEQLIRLLLGEEFQNHLADLRFGVPVRQEALQRTWRTASAGERFFFSELPKATVAYHLNDAYLYALVTKGISRILSGLDEVESGTAELASAVRTICKLR